MTTEKQEFICVRTDCPGTATARLGTAETKRAKPDQVEKLLEDYNDVFADIINGLIYEGKPVVREEALEAGATESLYHASEDGFGEQRRDVFKRDRKGGTEFSVWFGLENQTGVDYGMPVRVMGYDYAAYRQNLKKRKRGKRLEPVVTLVLYFGNRRWKGPKRLHEMLGLSGELAGYVPDYPINLIEVAYLEEETIERFRSDFRLVAEYFRARRLGREESMRYNTRKIEHVGAMLEFLKTFAHYERYEEIHAGLKEKSERGEEIRMCNLVDQWIDMGKKEGEETGRYRSLFCLIQNGVPEAEGMRLLNFTKAEAEGYPAWSMEQQNPGR